MNTYQTREAVPVEETWRLEDIYESEAAWQKDYEQVVELTKKLKEFDGQIHNGGLLLNYLKLEEEISFVYRKLFAYGMLQNDLDTRVTSAQVLRDKASQLGQQVSAARAFFMPFLLGLEEETLKNYIEEAEGLTYFEKDLYEAYRYKKHVLSKEKEEIVALMGEALAAPSKIYGMINNADIKFGEVTNDDGEKVELTRGMFAKLIKSEDREKRKEAYKAYYKPYVEQQNTIASTLASAIKNNVLTTKLREYPSALEKALFSDVVPKEVYENLIQVTRDHIAPMHKYTEIRKQLLGLEELRPYDLNVSLVQGVEKEISYEEAYSLMLKSLEPLGEDYVSTLASFKEKRYFDVRETPAKRSGAYNMGVYGVHPFVLLNHQDDIRSLFTLTHECGHAMHSYYSSKHQPQISAGYSIFVAEVASTVNEILLIRYLLETTEDTQMKKYLLNYFIDSFKGTFFTQVMFAEFEKLTHEKAEQDEPLNVEIFNSIYEDIFRVYNGEALEFDEEVKYGWSRIPHFYRPFYVYKYATGYVSAIQIADKILSGDQEVLQNYLTFLKSGSSEYPLELLKKTGVDLMKPEPIQNALSIFSDLVEEFASL
ncbi:oligoendopeptidase F [Bacillus mesophilus]|uniref:Oligopeptidase F n=1 Tax=Bacillus mesophilus TaxID=1808955 RepID=A0A6M0QEG9_9BACI|nr:oligoendopeptidase F [Bacillus mesophilus]MBM7662976.1 oligoendopeptidase F [Bacillus mesophilus]NEY73698.1 oligoendopeptidase F [Bacillus mesophilus]